ncbi:MAG: ABC transporter ATP-binding protein [Firmicutes bacterium]|jgi:ABC-2 type transport system ATP-binding protein|nr:ABC transporter ATP-binding protein [Bacillota bacterium]
MNAAVEVSEVSKVYTGLLGGRPVRALEGISLQVGQGEVFGLLGPNGAGKTTLLRILAGLVSPTTGSVRIMGLDLARERRRALTAITSVPDGGRGLYPRMTVMENIQYFAVVRGGLSARDLRRLELEAGRWLRFLGIDGCLGRPVNDLSRGTRQKVALVSALVTGSRVILMDEPTSGLDVAASRDLCAAIRRLAVDEGRTVILSTHQMDVAQGVCSRVCIVSRGRILALDRVPRLLQLFSTRTYRMVLEGNLEPTEAEALRRLGHFELVRECGQTTVTLDLNAPTAFYDAVEILRGRRVPIRAILRQEPDLLRVFLRITSAGGGDCDVPGSTIG